MVPSPVSAEDFPPSGHCWNSSGVSARCCNTCYQPPRTRRTQGRHTSLGTRKRYLSGPLVGRSWAIVRHGAPERRETCQLEQRASKCFVTLVDIDFRDDAIL